MKARHLEQERETLLLFLGDQGRGIEIRLGVVDGEHHLGPTQRRPAGFPTATGRRSPATLTRSAGSASSAGLRASNAWAPVDQLGRDGAAAGAPTPGNANSNDR